jgi:hypothetical protein
MDQRPIVPVCFVAAASNLSIPDQANHVRRRFGSAGVIRGPSLAVLCALKCVDTQETNSLTVELQGVAITHGGITDEISRHSGKREGDEQ